MGTRVKDHDAKCNRCGVKTPDADTLMGYCIDCYMHGCRKLFAAINDAVDQSAVADKFADPGFTLPKSRLH